MIKLQYKKTSLIAGIEEQHKWFETTINVINNNGKIIGEMKKISLKLRDKTTGKILCIDNNCNKTGRNLPARFYFKKIEIDLEELMDEISSNLRKWVLSGKDIENDIISDYA